MNILFISLGCDKNLVDSEVMLGILAKDGHQMVDDETMADVIIINTCCFIHDAKEESIQNILEMADLKKTGRLKALIVTGCLAQRYKEEIIQEIPEVDAVLGTTSYEEIAHVIDGVLSDSPMERAPDYEGCGLSPGDRHTPYGDDRRTFRLSEDCRRL